MLIFFLSSFVFLTYSTNSPIRKNKVDTIYYGTAFVLQSVDMLRRHEKSLKCMYVNEIPMIRIRFRLVSFFQYFLIY
jgi:hypothetical protein